MLAGPPRLRHVGTTNVGRESLCRPRTEPHQPCDRGARVDTLRTWLRTGCSTTETARALRLHPHTVSDRLRRVAVLTGTDPRETDDVFERQVALMVRDVQHAAGS